MPGLATTTEHVSLAGLPLPSVASTVQLIVVPTPPTSSMPTVWVRFGGMSKKKVAQVITVSAAQPVAKKRRITRSMTVALKGKNLAATQTGQTAAVYITPYSKTRNFDSFCRRAPTVLVAAVSS